MCRAAAAVGSSSRRKREGARVVLAVVATAAEVQRLVYVCHIGFARNAANRQVHLPQHLEFMFRKCQLSASVTCSKLQHADFYV